MASRRFSKGNRKQLGRRAQARTRYEHTIALVRQHRHDRQAAQRTFNNNLAYVKCCESFKVTESRIKKSGDRIWLRLYVLCRGPGEEYRNLTIEDWQVEAYDSSELDKAVTWHLLAKHYVEASYDALLQSPGYQEGLLSTILTQHSDFEAGMAELGLNVDVDISPAFNAFEDWASSATPTIEADTTRATSFVPSTQADGEPGNNDPVTGKYIFDIEENHEHLYAVVGENLWLAEQQNDPMAWSSVVAGCVTSWADEVINQGIDMTMAWDT